MLGTGLAAVGQEPRGRLCRSMPEYLAYRAGARVRLWRRDADLLVVTTPVFERPTQLI